MASPKELSRCSDIEPPCTGFPVRCTAQRATSLMGADTARSTEPPDA